MLAMKIMCYIVGYVLGFAIIMAISNARDKAEERRNRDTQIEFLETLKEKYSEQEKKYIEQYIEIVKRW